LIVHRILKQVLMESAEEWDDGIPIGIGKASTKKGAWERSAQAEEESRRDRLGRGKSVKREEAQNGPIPLDVLHDIAEETSETERHAADAERELLEWKKIKFMQDHVGEEFTGLIISVTKFGFFVELADLFIEGLVPLSSLIDDRYIFNDRTKQIIGQRTHKQYSLGDQVRVMVDRIDPVLHKINFMVVTDEPQ
jgi:ribonuclease R